LKKISRIGKEYLKGALKVARLKISDKSLLDKSDHKFILNFSQNAWTQNAIIEGFSRNFYLHSVIHQ
jgi:hypothetical protein